MMSFGNRITLEAVEKHMLEFGLGNALLIEDVRFLYRLANGLSAGSLMLEIGTQHGRSTRVMSMAANGATIITIDPIDLWSGELPANVVRLLMRSESVSPLLDANPDMIFIDGDHSEAGVLLDIKNYTGKLKSGGILAFHDYHPNHPGVISAVDKFSVTNEWVRIMPVGKESGTACIAFVKP